MSHHSSNGNSLPGFSLDYDDDLDDDLNFTQTVDTSVKQDVSINPPSRSFETSYETSAPPTGSPPEPQGFIQPQPPQFLSESSHPIACIFHCLFKFCALTLYIFGGWFTKGPSSESHFIIITVLCILFLSADFWVVKNITGRLLVGLRWWNRVLPDGQTKWIFESAEGTRQVNRFDHAIFWTVMYIAPAIWGFCFFFGLLKFHLGWLITVTMGFSLSGSNLYGYWKCSSDQKARMNNLMARGAEMGASAAIRNNVFAVFSRFASKPTAQTQSNASATYV